MQFQDQIVQQIILVDNNGNAIIVIGPTPEIDIIGAPPSTSKIVLHLDSNGFPAIEFTNDAGNVFTITAFPGSSELALFAGTVASAISELALDINGDIRFSTASGTAVNPHVIYQQSTGRLQVGNPGATVRGWTAIPLTAGFASGGSAAVYKPMPDGMVKLAGNIIGPVSPIPGGTVIATMPVGYRPFQDLSNSIVFDGSATHGKVVIRAATGNIECYDAPNNLPIMDDVFFSSI